MNSLCRALMSEIDDKLTRAGTLAAPSVSNLGVLEARLLTKRYAGIPVVDHVSFAIEPGEILGYVGPNGAGKSTTVKMLTGLTEPTSGHIYFHGREVRDGLKALLAHALRVGHQRRMPVLPQPEKTNQLVHFRFERAARQAVQASGQLQIFAPAQVRIKITDYN
jgi:ABC-type sugar transport system ATPase subunit